MNRPSSDINKEASRLVGAQLGADVPAAVEALADTILKRHGAAVAAVLYYGSCRRTGVLADNIIDLYAVVHDYRAVHGRGPAAAANAVLPPNVYYVEAEVGKEDLARAKYAVISVAALARHASSRVAESYIWGRFAQPVTLVYAADGKAADAVARALVEAARTLLAETVPLMPERFSAAELWQRAFIESFRTELRAEGPDRSGQLYASDADHYTALARALLAEPGIGVEEIAAPSGVLFRRTDGERGRGRARRRWWWRRRRGKLMSVLRLAKATFTFEGGIDYILWKVGRHSGVHLTATPWQRRHPLLGATVLYWRLYLRGGFK